MNRDFNTEHTLENFRKNSLKNIEKAIREASISSYINGYNFVLKAVDSVFGWKSNEYKSVIKALEKMENPVKIEYQVDENHKYITKCDVYPDIFVGDKKCLLCPLQEKTTQKYVYCKKMNDFEKSLD